MLVKVPRCWEGSPVSDSSIGRFHLADSSIGIPSGPILLDFALHSDPLSLLPPLLTPLISFLLPNNAAFLTPDGGIASIGGSSKTSHGSAGWLPAFGPQAFGPVVSGTAVFARGRKGTLSSIPGAGVENDENEELPPDGAGVNEELPPADAGCNVENEELPNCVSIGGLEYVEGCVGCPVTISEPSLHRLPTKSRASCVCKENRIAWALLSRSLHPGQRGSWLSFSLMHGPQTTVLQHGHTWSDHELLARHRPH